MSDYIEILDTQIEPDAPLTAVLAGQWRDNCIAIAQGAPGAPRLRGLAAMTPREYSVLFPLVVQEIGTGNFPSGTVPSYAYDGSWSTTTTSSSSFVSAGAVTITARATGTFRFSAQATYTSGISGGIRSQIRLLKNGVEIGIASTITGNTDGTNVTLTVDAAGAVGDVFEWEVRLIGGANGRIQNISISGEFDPIETIALPIKQSERRP
jgi:hypothetical protein